MRVDGEAVVRVALRPAADVAPRREISPQEPEPVEQGERTGAVGAGAHQAQEPVADPVVPDDRVRHLGPGERVDESRPRLRPALGHVGQHGEHVGRPIDRLRRRAAAAGTRERQRALHHSVDDASAFEHRTHQGVDRRQTRLVFEPHARRHLGLQVGRQPVGSLPGLHVHGVSCPHQKLLGLVDRRSVVGADQSRVDERLPHRDGEPVERGDVAKPADAVLEVGREVVGTRSGVPTAPDAILDQGRRERGRIRQRRGPARLERALHEGRRPRNRTPVEQGGPRVQTLPRRRQARLRRPDERRHRESLVPQRIPQAPSELGQGVVVEPVMEQQDVDVGGRQLQPAAVAAERDDRGVRAQVVARCLDEPGVERIGSFARRPAPLLAGRIRAGERVDAAPERSGVGHRPRGRPGPSRPCGSARRAPPRRPRACRRRSCPSERPSTIASTTPSTSPSSTTTSTRTLGTKSTWYSAPR